MSTASILRRTTSDYGQRSPQFGKEEVRSRTSSDNNNQNRNGNKGEGRWRELMAKREYFLKNI